VAISPKKIGLFFGSFNPVHVGHMIIANHMINETDLDQVWMVVSPQNPHKKKNTLAKDYDRLNMVKEAIGDNIRIKASNIEFGLSIPSYTVDTLAYLTEKYPKDEFSLIMGGDNIGSFHKWKNYEVILKYHNIFVYSRPNYELGDLANHPKVTILEAPLLDISASYIRNCIKEGKSIRYLVSDKVYDFIKDSGAYKFLNVSS